MQIESRLNAKVDHNEVVEMQANIEELIFEYEKTMGDRIEQR